MTNVTHIAGNVQPTGSPLLLCDRLPSLAENADHAGLREKAMHLVDE